VQRARFTGYQLDGGYADHVLADARYCLPLPGLRRRARRPLLCAGLIGYRALRMAGEARRIGIYGFGAAAHIVRRWPVPGRDCLAFVRPATRTRHGLQCRSLQLGRRSDERPPEALDAAIIFAPVGALVPAALAAVRPAVRGLRRHPHERHPVLPYALLWGSARSAPSRT